MPCVVKVGAETVGRRVSVVEDMKRHMLGVADKVSLSARRRSDGLGGGLQGLEAGASAVRQTCYHAEPQIDLDFHIAHSAASSSHHHDPCPRLAPSLPQGYRV